MNKQFSKMGPSSGNGNGAQAQSHMPFNYHNHHHNAHGNIMGEILDVDCSKDLSMFMSQIDSLMLNNYN